MKRKNFAPQSGNCDINLTFFACIENHRSFNQNAVYARNVSSQIIEKENEINCKWKSAKFVCKFREAVHHSSILSLCQFTSDTEKIFINFIWA